MNEQRDRRWGAAPHRKQGSRCTGGCRAGENHSATPSSWVRCPRAVREALGWEAELCPEALGRAALLSASQPGLCELAGTGWQLVAGLGQVPITEVGQGNPVLAAGMVRSEV